MKIFQFLIGDEADGGGFVLPGKRSKKLSVKVPGIPSEDRFIKAFTWTARRGQQASKDTV